MATILKPQQTIPTCVVDDALLTWMKAFLYARKAEGLATGSLRFYQQKLKLFLDYCQVYAIDRIGQITAGFIRQYLLYLRESDHNEGGTHAAFRSLHAFLNWYENEAMPEGWGNPIRKVKAPKVPTEPLDPVTQETVAGMIKACDRGTFTGDRDAAILLCLLDTGARASEFLNVNLDDLNQATGAMLIRKGKGGKNPSFKSFHNHAGFAQVLAEAFDQVGRYPDQAGGYTGKHWSPGFSNYFGGGAFGR